MTNTIQSPDSDTVTEGVRVRAAAHYVASESDPDRCSYVYDYQVVLTNDSERTVQLRRRHWIILDAHGNRDEVVGKGVVGECPRLGPGESFKYVSRCPLNSRWGTMEGEYVFVDDAGKEFDVAIGRFFLVPPASVD